MPTLGEMGVVHRRVARGVQLPLLDADHRIQTVFTVPGSGDIWHGTTEFVHRCGAVALPWRQALQHQWDLVLSASHRHIEQVHGPILLMPHGAGSLQSRRRSRKAGTPTRDTTGLDRELLTFRGRVIPAAVALTTERELQAPRALPMAVPRAIRWAPARPAPRGAQPRHYRLH